MNEREIYFLKYFFTPIIPLLVVVGTCLTCECGVREVWEDGQHQRHRHGCVSDGGSPHDDHNDIHDDHHNDIHGNIDNSIVMTHISTTTQSGFGKTMS